MVMVNIVKEQFDFMPGRSTTDPILGLRQPIERYRDGQQNLHCVSIDLENAYDQVPREEVWHCMRLKGVRERYVQLVQDMYEDNTAYTKCINRYDEVFSVSVGLHQESTFSSFLFAMIMNC